jgi:predicted O-methyltransferase YrrM
MGFRVIYFYKFLLRRIFPFIGKFKNKIKIFPLHYDSDSFLKSVADIFDAIKQNRCSYEERRWIEKIEMLRNSLSTSTIELPIVDYGSISPTTELSTEEMYKGTNIIRTIGEVCQNAAKQHKWGLMILLIIRKFRPTVCLELGTSLGISAAYQAAACEINNYGKVITLEGSESLVSLAVKNLKSLGVNRAHVVSGRFQDTLPNVLKKYGPIDFVFIDGHHDEHATVSYFKQILTHLSDNAILIFDDIHWSSGMERAWNIIHQDSNIKISLDIFEMGICLFTKSKNENKEYFKVAI